jgi:hypothetical protein
MQVAATSSAIRVPCASTRVSSSRSALGNVAGLTPFFRARSTRAAVVVRAEKQQVCVPESHQLWPQSCGAQGFCKRPWSAVGSLLLLDFDQKSLGRRIYITFVIVEGLNRQIQL